MANLDDMSLEDLQALRTKIVSDLASKTSPVNFQSPAIADQYNQTSDPVKAVSESAPKPFQVNSGYRTIQHNAEVGGVPGSLHTNGEALDLGNDTDPDVIDHFESHGFKVIPEPNKNHIHVQLKPLDDMSLEELTNLRNQMANRQAVNISQSQPASPVTAQPQTPIQDNIDPQARQAYEQTKQGTGPFEQAIGTTLQQTARTGSAGMLPYLMGIADTINGNNTQNGILNSIRKNADLEKQVEDLRVKASPTAALAGDIAGYAAPGGAFGLLTKAAKPLVAAGGEALPYLEKVPGFLKNITSGATTGALANAGYNTINPEATQSLGEALKTGAEGGGGGATLGELLGAGGNGLKSLASRIMNNAVGTPAKELLRRNLGQELLDRYVFGTSKSLANKAASQMEDIGAQKNSILQGMQGAVGPEESVAQLQQLQENLPKTGSSAQRQMIQDRIDELNAQNGPGMSPVEADIEKTKLGKRVGSNAYEQANPTLSKQIDQANARGLRIGLENLNPDIAPTNEDYSVYRRLADNLEKLEAKGGNKLPSGISPMKDFPAGYFGYHVGGMHGGLEAIAAMEALRRIMGTTLGKTINANALYQAGKGLQALSPELSPLGAALYGQRGQ